MRYSSAVLLGAARLVGLSAAPLPVLAADGAGPVAYLSEELLSDDWRWSGPAVLYTRDDLHEYMNGGARFYLSYDFQRLGVRTCVGPDKVPVTVEVYEFASGGDAMGLYIDDTSGEPIDGPWQAAVWGMGLLKLHKGRFVVRIHAARRSDIVRQPQTAMAERLARGIDDLARPPELLAALSAALERQDEITARATRFFHTRESLDSYYYLGESNVLGLSPRVDCALLEYSMRNEEAERGRLLLALYGSAEEAARAFEAFATSHLQVEVEDVEDAPSVVSLDNDRWAGLATHEDELLLCAVLEADSRHGADVALELAERVRTLLKEATEDATDRRDP